MSDARRIMRDAPEMLADLFDAIASAAAERGMNQDDADALALAVVDQLADAYAGQLLYFGKGTHMRLRQRDLDMYRDFDGHNHAELADKYKLSVVRVYAIIKKVTELISVEGQQSLL